ncbi:hypothetical protein D5018_06625 [Parashewanella curva]|uniref:Uncharacterized protein n=1 Tax=Parashewanella curva TaxID=2338552 RepID=A0A3L8Q172_9GAMM|nr:hypothetical protein [Parashewanella curva]RLV60463.1 hypothetical protein D5018_06625 [Parashewanella curva]
MATTLQSSIQPLFHYDEQYSVYSTLTDDQFTALKKRLPAEISAERGEIFTVGVAITKVDGKIVNEQRTYTLLYDKSYGVKFAAYHRGNGQLSVSESESDVEKLNKAYQRSVDYFKGYETAEKVVPQVKSVNTMSLRSVSPNTLLTPAMLEEEAPQLKTAGEKNKHKKNNLDTVSIFTETFYLAEEPGFEGWLGLHKSASTETLNLFCVLYPSSGEWIFEPSYDARAGDIAPEKCLSNSDNHSEGSLDLSCPPKQLSDLSPPILPSATTSLPVSLAARAAGERLMHSTSLDDEIVAEHVSRKKKRPVSPETPEVACSFRSTADGNELLKTGEIAQVTNLSEVCEVLNLERANTVIVIGDTLIAKPEKNVGFSFRSTCKPKVKNSFARWHKLAVDKSKEMYIVVICDENNTETTSGLLKAQGVKRTAESKTGYQKLFSYNQDVKEAEIIENIYVSKCTQAVTVKITIIGDDLQQLKRVILALKKKNVNVEGVNVTGEKHLVSKLPDARSRGKLPDIHSHYIGLEAKAAASSDR